jgi:hypothetical protein
LQGSRVEVAPETDGRIVEEDGTHWIRSD